MSRDSGFLALCHCIFIALFCTLGESTRCYQCKSIRAPYLCDKVVECLPSEECFFGSYINDGLVKVFDMACKAQAFCSALGKRDVEMMTNNTSLFDSKNSGDALFDVQPNPSDKHHRSSQLTLSSECCTTDHCNLGLSPASDRPPGLKCYDCGSSLLNDPADCQTANLCAADEKCSVNEVVSAVGRKFQVGCRNKLVCDAIGSHTPFGKRDVYMCHTCCDYDNCNIDYCSRKRPLPSVTNSTTVTPSTTPSTTSMGSISSSTSIKLQLQGVLTPLLTLTEGSLTSISLICGYGGTPKPTYRWTFKDRNNIIHDLTPLGPRSDPNLPLKDINRNRTGTYTCNADNGFDRQTQQHQVIVQYSPEFVNQPRTDVLNIKVGDNFTFNCLANGEPKPTYMFQFLDENTIPSILPNLVIDLHKGTLRAIKVDNFYSGTYTCFARNSLGMARQVLKVKVGV